MRRGLKYSAAAHRLSKVLKVGCIVGTNTETIQLCVSRLESIWKPSYPIIPDHVSFLQAGGASGLTGTGDDKIIRPSRRNHLVLAISRHGSDLRMLCEQHAGNSGRLGRLHESRRGIEIFTH